jgi:hypothetical protein
LLLKQCDIEAAEVAANGAEGSEAELAAEARAWEEPLIQQPAELATEAAKAAEASWVSAE